jgi:hypothetical protein
LSSEIDKFAAGQQYRMIAKTPNTLIYEDA